MQEKSTTDREIKAAEIYGVFVRDLDWARQHLTADRWAYRIGQSLGVETLHSEDFKQSFAPLVLDKLTTYAKEILEGENNELFQELIRGFEESYSQWSIHPESDPVRAFEKWLVGTN